MDAHSFAARNFAHLYVVSGKQHSMCAVADADVVDKVWSMKYGYVYGQYGYNS